MKKSLKDDLYPYEIELFEKIGLIYEIMTSYSGFMFEHYQDDLIKQIFLNYINNSSFHFILIFSRQMVLSIGIENTEVITNGF